MKAGKVYLLHLQQRGFHGFAAAVVAVGVEFEGVGGEDAVAGVEEGQGIAGADGADGAGGTELGVGARLAVGYGEQGRHDAALEGSHARGELQGQVKGAAGAVAIFL